MVPSLPQSLHIVFGGKSPTKQKELLVYPFCPLLFYLSLKS